MPQFSLEDKPPTASVKGTVVEYGDDSDGQPRILIHTTREELRDGPALAYREVEVTLAGADDRAGSPDAADAFAYMIANAGRVVGYATKESVSLCKLAPGESLIPVYERPPTPGLRLFAAGRKMLQHRVGDLPSSGYIRDNDESRKDIAAFASALAVEPVVYRADDGQYKVEGSPDIAPILDQYSKAAAIDTATRVLLSESAYLCDRFGPHREPRMHAATAALKEALEAGGNLTTFMPYPFILTTVNPVPVPREGLTMIMAILKNSKHPDAEHLLHGLAACCSIHASSVKSD